MSYDSPFTPLGPTYLVTGGPTQILSSPGQSFSSMRIHNLGSSVTRVAWVSGVSNPPVSLNPGIPSTATPIAPNTMLIAASGIEVVGLAGGSQGVWVAVSGNSVEVIPGEGIR